MEVLWNFYKPRRIRSLRSRFSTFATPDLFRKQKQQFDCDCVGLLPPVVVRWFYSVSHVYWLNYTGLYVLNEESKIKAVCCFFCRFIEMAGHKVAHAVLKGPSVVKELCIGSVLALAAGSLWKMHHWNEQRKVRTFYDLLEKGEIGVVVQEE
ncbi:hypothetical protein G4B88_005431 [Cannabis sativa]|uniref:Cytochrome c oxidase subunit 5C n=1 Tax=Cannabis sativa TaxID=3483 RepID=A0A7J6HB62_CANSA|nr:hypothetical protein G4B88_005431 [Cannabis sativa]